MIHLTVTTITTATEPEAISTPDPEVSDSVETVIDTIPEAENSEAPVPVTPDLTPDPAPMAEANPAETIMVETDALTTEISVSPDTADSAEEIPKPIAEVTPPKGTVPFSQLPDEAFIRQKALLRLHLIPWSAASLWRKCRSGHFPQPIKISSGITAWRIRDIRAWLADPAGYGSTRPSGKPKKRSPKRNMPA